MPFTRPTTPGAKCKMGTPGCRPKPKGADESQESYDKRVAKWKMSYERRGGVKFYEMNTEQRKAFLKAGGNKQRMTEAIQKHEKNKKTNTPPAPNPPKGGNNPGPNPRDPNYSSSGSGLSRLSPEARQQFLQKKRARMAAAKGPLGGK